MDNKTILRGEELEQAVKSLSVGWSVLPGKGLVRVIETDGFKTGFALVSHIAQIAEVKEYDPELTLRRGEIEIVLNTYEAGGLTEPDITMAQAIDELIA